MPKSQQPKPDYANPALTLSDPCVQKANDLVRFAKTLPLTDGGVRTAQLLSDALAYAPDHHDALVLRERLHQTCVPRWHFPMLADKTRNAAYAKAINATVRPGDIVLDIGCGAGLTAMLAARAGAKHVYTCEQQPLIAAAAERVIADNGLSDRITVLSKWSHTMVIGEDMPEHADVVISEIVDNVLLGEGALATLTHAMGCLAKPDARAIPERGVLMAQLVESDYLVDHWRPQNAQGFDLGAFHPFSRIAYLTPHDLAACKLRPLGPTSNLFHVDFTSPSVTPVRSTVDLACTEAGTAHAVLVSFKMHLSSDCHVTNGLNAQGHWGRSAFLLDADHPVKPGDTQRVIAQHDAAHLSIHMQMPSKAAPAQHPHSQRVAM